MKLSRERELQILWVLNELVPPAVRDARWFVPTVYRIFFPRVAPLLREFKERAPHMSDAEYADAYAQMAPFTTTLGTDLNRACLERLERDVKGPSVLDVGCGEGLLARRLAARSDLRVTALDLDVTPTGVGRATGIEGVVERLPFRDESFDTVVCTHTLEHVRDLPRAVAELRRVARQQLVVVVPRERPYRYTFNLHLQFFPYPHALILAIGGRNGSCEVVGGDLYYEESA